MRQGLSAIFGNCFPPGTLVSTEDGPKAIEDIRAGQNVWACDLSTETWKLCNVSDTLNAIYHGDIVTLEVAGASIDATGNHPFWVLEGDELEKRRMPEHVYALEPGVIGRSRWVDARDLRNGDLVLHRSGEFSRITRIKSRPESMVVFNIRVEELHTYAVGRNEILVHNRPGDVVGPRAPRPAL